MQNNQILIVPLRDAVIIRCVVKNKDTGEIYYEGDSSYEASIAYNQMSMDGKPVAYILNKTRLVPEATSDKMTDKKFLGTYAQEVVKKLPERIRNIYAATLSNTELPVEVIQIAKKYHPEYFNQTSNKRYGPTKS